MNQLFLSALCLEQRDEWEQPPLLRQPSSAAAAESVCMCVLLVCNPGALWEGWLINILSGEAGLGGIYLRGLFCSWNVPHAFNNSTGIFFFSLLPLDTVPTSTTSGLKMRSPSPRQRTPTEESHISGILFTRLCIYDCTYVSYFCIMHGSRRPWTGSILLYLERLNNKMFRLSCLYVSNIYIYIFYECFKVWKC